MSKSMFRSLLALTILLPIIVVSTCLLTEEEAEAVLPPSRDEVATLVFTIENLQTHISNLQKQVYTLTDLLQKIVDMAEHSATPVKAAVPVRALRSPRQIDRPPVREEATDVRLAKLNTFIEDEEQQRVISKLLTTKNNSSFVLSLRTQVSEWLDTPSDERSFNSPLSTKQFAWAAFLMFPSEYPNPKSVKELYP